MSVKYIFSINTGRSGSDYLTALLKQVDNVVSIHEGLPMMNGVPMQQFNNGDEAALRALMPLKVAEIEKACKNGRKIYAETNHSFIKGWGYLLPDAYIPQEEMGVIILRREPEKIIQSMLRVRDLPGATVWSRTWYLTPGSARDIVPPPTSDNPADFCQWYIDEVAARAAAYQEQFPKITYVTCDLQQLNDYDFVVAMLETFGLQPTLDLREVVGKRLNVRSEWPKRTLAELTAPSPYPNPDDLEPAAQEKLMAQMIAYLHTHKQAQITAVKPDYKMGGSIGFGMNQIVAETEPELEEAFQVSLKYTNFEWSLISEFLRSVTDVDLFLLVGERLPGPGIRYSYDFNGVLTAKDIVAQFGIKGVLRLLIVILKGYWGRDITHRGD